MEVLDEPEAKASLTACPRGSMWLLTPPPVGRRHTCLRSPRSRHAVATAAPVRRPQARKKSWLCQAGCKLGSSGFRENAGHPRSVGSKKGHLELYVKSQVNVPEVVMFWILPDHFWSGSIQNTQNPTRRRSVKQVWPLQVLIPNIGKVTGECGDCLKNSEEYPNIVTVRKTKTRDSGASWLVHRPAYKHQKPHHLPSKIIKVRGWSTLLNLLIGKIHLPAWQNYVRPRRCAL